MNYCNEVDVTGPSEYVFKQQNHASLQLIECQISQSPWMEPKFNPYLAFFFLHANQFACILF